MNKLPRELKNADIDFVSYVDRPANKRKFFMTKSKEELNMNQEQLSKVLEQALKPIVDRIEQVEKARGINQNQSITKSQNQSNGYEVFDDLFTQRKENIEKSKGETQTFQSLQDRLGLPEVVEKEEDEDFVAGRDFTDVHGERTSQKINGKHSFLDWDPNKEEDENAPKNYY